MNGITRYTIKLNKKKLNELNKVNIHAPAEAKECTILYSSRDVGIVDTYTFTNKKHKVIKRIKHITNALSGEDTTQIRYYKYTTPNKKSKISEINQYTFDSNNKCTGGTSWRFYYPPTDRNVRFAQSGSEGTKNNFIEADDCITDRNGLKILPITIAEYLERKRQLGVKNYIDAPWTTKESITRKSAATDCIAECSSVGVIGKKGISLNHLNPNNPSNHDFTVIENTLSDQIKEQGKNSKAFLIGSIESDYESTKQYDALSDFLYDKGIPFSSFKTGDRTYKHKLSPLAGNNKRHTMFDDFDINPYDPSYIYNIPGQHILYDNGKLMISNLVIDKEMLYGNYDPKSLIKKSFDKVKL